MTDPQQLRAPLLAIDPGREKCGIAVVTWQRVVLVQEIIPTTELSDRLAYHLGKHGIELIILGDRTGSQDVLHMIRDAALPLEIDFVNEDRSSEQGRQRFLAANPPRGLLRLLPAGLRSPSRPYDDYVAVILAERYLDGQRSTRKRHRGKR